MVGAAAFVCGGFRSGIGRRRGSRAGLERRIMTATDSWAPELGILGTGRMGSRLAAMFARAGRRVMLGSRDSERAAALVESLDIPTLRAGCYSEAARAPAILPAVFMRDGLLDLLERYCSAL